MSKSFKSSDSFIYIISFLTETLTLCCTVALWQGIYVEKLATSNGATNWSLGILNTQSLLFAFEICLTFLLALLVGSVREFDKSFTASYDEALLKETMGLIALYMSFYEGLVKRADGDICKNVRCIDLLRADIYTMII